MFDSLNESLAANPLSRRTFIAATGAAAAMAGGALAQPAVAAQAPQASAAAPPAAERESLKLAKAAVQSVEKTIIQISREVWDLPAVGLQEQEAMEVHLRVLEAAGFTIISRATAGHPTAFVAEWSLGRGGPKLGFLPEYDALPGLGNAAEAKPAPASNGKTDGHGCGHNCLGAGCTGAALALKAIMTRQQTPGLLRVYGCGAEENQGAKVYMAKAGLFNDLDAALSWHSAPAAVTGTVITAANRKISISWQGKTAHAGNTPWDGRSALDAAELFAHGVNLMREHVQPTARLHYIYEVAGVAPNIVPDQARIWMTARDASSPLVQATTDWLAQLAEGAALGTQTKASFNVPLGVSEMVPNLALAQRVREHMVHTPLEWSAEEQAFAKACQKQMNLPETGLATAVLPLIQEIKVGGSSDVADVSWNTPIVLFGWPTLPQGVSLHSWAVTACGGMSIGDKGTLAAATILAAIGLDLLTDADLRTQAKEEWKQRLNGRPYTAVLNIDPQAADETARRFSKGPGEEALSGVDR